jgi:hypothetical protein
MSTAAQTGFVDGLKAIMRGATNLNMWIHLGVIVAGAVIAMTSFALLIPLDSVPAATGVTIILAVSYMLALVMWVGALWFYANDTAQLTWLNTNIMFLIVLPATIGATAMCVTSVQNTRNLLAGQVA